MADKDDEEEYEYEDDDEYEDDEDWEDDEDDEARAAREEAEAKARKKKRLVTILAVAGVLLVLGGGGFAAHMLGLTEKIFGKPDITEVTLDLGKPVTAPLPEIRTDLKTTGRRNHFIKLNIIVQLNETDLPALKDATKTAMIVDGIKTHLRGMEFKDLQGKAGSERLRYELLNVINHTLAPVQAHTILFKDLIIQ